MTAIEQHSGKEPRVKRVVATDERRRSRRVDAGKFAMKRKKGLLDEMH